MKRFFKDYYITVLAVLGLTVLAFATSVDIHTWTGAGSRSNTVEFKIQEATVGSAADFIPGTDNANSLGTSSLRFDDIQSYDATLSDDLTVVDDIYRVSESAVAHSTTTGEGTIKWAYLAGSTDAIVGHLLVFANAALGTSQGVTVTVADAAADLTTWAGVCAVAASTGGVVGVYSCAGDWVIALTTGSVSEGQTLVSDATNDGYLKADATPTTGADVGVALEDGTTAGGSTLIQLR